MKRQLLTLALILLLALTACGKRGKDAPDTAEDIQPVTVEELSLKELDDFITVSGKLEGADTFTMSSDETARPFPICLTLSIKTKYNSH